MSLHHAHSASPYAVLLIAPIWQVHAAYKSQCFTHQTSFLLAVLTLRIALHQALALHTDKAPLAQQGHTSGYAAKVYMQPALYSATQTWSLYRVSWRKWRSV